MASRLLAVALLPVLLGASGCAYLTGGLGPYGKPVTAGQLIGTWTGDCASTLVLRPDLTLTATGFPLEFDEHDQISTRTSGAGQWTVPTGDTAHPPERLPVSIGQHGYEVDLAMGAHGALVLAVTVGDPDEGVGCRYTRR
ncbi:hypothetical protein CFP65_6139 [Kitasatospora sp. MMS16-BH015]|uniref:hypothetical protein n=1 Tax=Kitasatospora sp. MMS16-BH015 TaxID=2018025 RepID=UPI000CA398EC|nr:hypothetical protein [Kitasatospora sp. MMS16-BH015]AUG80806.1 hypothetical protein CFP65_6139 [Kitasatospora sp. MMS16-BH015]